MRGQPFHSACVAFCQPLLEALLGIPQPVRKIEADAVGREGHFVAGIDGVAFSALLSRLDDLLGALPKAQPAPVSQ